MSQSVDETRREFLLDLARASAFVPPAVLTLGVGRALGQRPAHAGRPTPTASLESPDDFDDVQRLPGEQQPWDAGRAGGAPPWSRPPPTQGGPGPTREGPGPRR